MISLRPVIEYSRIIEKICQTSAMIKTKKTGRVDSC